MNSQKENCPLLCDVEIGCAKCDKQLSRADNKPLKLIYFTDPICSSCWGIEPQLRKFKLKYGHLIDIDYRMDGLLADWSYNSGGINGP